MTYVIWHNNGVEGLHLATRYTPEQIGNLGKFLVDMRFKGIVVYKVLTYNDP